MMGSFNDIIVIGGGIVGLAVARRLLQIRPECRLLLLEKEGGLATHQTGHNSGVIHAGLYYRPGSRKAVLCTRGREALYAYLAEREIPHRPCGKLVVATDETQVERLRSLRQRGMDNGLDGLEWLDGEATKRYEPSAEAVAALFVPQTGVVDFRRVALAFADDVRDGGGIIRVAHRVRAVERCGDGFRLETSGGTVTGRAVINCGGLQSDRIARLCGVDPGLRIIPFRGEYYRLRPTGERLVHNLIYPVPDPAMPFLGVHFTRGVDGTVEAGPNAVLAWRREGYSRWACSPRDLWDTLRYPGFWRLARREWRSGLREFRRAWSRSLFLGDLQRLVPGLRDEDLGAWGCGVRAQAVDGAGRLLDDFAIVSGDGMLHVLNAPSPAATASLAIGEELAQMAVEQFGL